MARSIRSSNLETRSARLKLPIAKKPIFVKIGPGSGSAIVGTRPRARG